MSSDGKMQKIISSQRQEQELAVKSEWDCNDQSGVVRLESGLFRLRLDPSWEGQRRSDLVRKGRVVILAQNV